MNVSEQDNEILDAVYGLASEPVLKQMAVAFVFFVEIVGKSYTDSLHDVTDMLFTLLDQQMNVVAHQAIGIEKTEWWQLQPLLVIPVSQSSEDGDHLLVVLIVLKDILTVDASEHHLVNTRTAFSLIGRAIGSIVFKCEGKDTNLFSNIQIFNAEK